MPSPQAACDLTAKKCVPCEGGVPKYSLSEAEAQLATLPAWRGMGATQSCSACWRA